MELLMICKIPPHLPFPKGGKYPSLEKSSLSLPLFSKEGLGEIL